MHFRGPIQLCMDLESINQIALYGPRINQSNCEFVSSYTIIISFNQVKFTYSSTKCRITILGVNKIFRKINRSKQYGAQKLPFG